MKKNKWNFLLTVLFLLVLIVPSHVIGIDKVVTIDEPWWVISGSNYCYALTHGDFENTLYDYHPAVTTTWIVTAGMLSYFPEYRGFGQGYFDVRKPKFEEFMRAHGKEAIDLVRNSRLIQTILLIALALLGYFLLQLLVDQNAAFLAIALAMTGPYFLGHARLLNHEGMLAMFVLVSFLGMQVYLNKDRRLIYLLISGGAFGLAQLTKSSSIVLIPLFGLILFSGLLKRNEQLLGIKIWNAAKTFVIWLAVAMFVFVLIWPGMWVAPGKMIYEIYGNAFSYAFQGARLEITQKLQPSAFTLVSGLDGVFQYLRSWAASSTILTWLGLIFALFLMTSKDRERPPLPIKSTLIYLALLSGLFIVMFGVAQGRNSPHYILSSYVCFDVIAGIGWGYLWVWVQERWVVLDRGYVYVLVFILLVGVQIGYTIPYYPYYFTYRNPITNTGGSRGYGEGLAQAAEYLAQKPNSKEIRAYVYNGMGTFSFFFPGETIVLKKIYLINGDMLAVADETRNADYLVLYPIVQNYLPESEKLLDALQDVVPEKTIFINDLEYIRIYKTTEIPESVYEKMSR